jgi:hypothetical protein|nr:MAG TPA: hypothetical protein [Caudoviricetes sp.]
MERTEATTGLTRYTYSSIPIFFIIITTVGKPQSILIKNIATISKNKENILVKNKCNYLFFVFGRNEKWEL